MSTTARLNVYQAAERGAEVMRRWAEATRTVKGPYTLTLSLPDESGPRIAAGDAAIDYYWARHEDEDDPALIHQDVVQDAITDVLHAAEEFGPVSVLQRAEQLAAHPDGLAAYRAPEGARVDREHAAQCITDLLFSPADVRGIPDMIETAWGDYVSATSDAVAEARDEHEYARARGGVPAEAAARVAALFGAYEGQGITPPALSAAVAAHRVGVRLTGRTAHLETPGRVLHSVLGCIVDDCGASMDDVQRAALRLVRQSPDGVPGRTAAYLATEDVPCRVSGPAPDLGWGERWTAAYENCRENLLAVAPTRREAIRRAIDRGYLIPDDEHDTGTTTWRFTPFGEALIGH